MRKTLALILVLAATALAQGPLPKAATDARAALRSTLSDLTADAIPTKNAAARLTLRRLLERAQRQGAAQRQAARPKAAARAAHAGGTGLHPDDLARVMEKGSLNLGYLMLLRFYEPNSQQSFDLGFAQFSKVTRDEVEGFHSAYYDRELGGCYAARLNAGGQVSEVGTMPTTGYFDFYFPVGSEPLAAGSEMTLSGPGGTQKMMEAAPGAYFGFLMGSGENPLTYFTPGDYTLAGSGGAQVGAFSSTVAVGAPVQWTNAAGLQTLSRGRDQEITWNAGGENDDVLVMGMSWRGDITANYEAGVVVCAERANAGKLTIPGAMLEQLPAAEGGDPNGALMFYSTTLGQRFQPGAGLDAGYVMTIGYSAVPTRVQ